MSSRKMWAPYYSQTSSFWVYAHPQPSPRQPDAPVLVTDASGMPELVPGDDVRAVGDATVIGYPFQYEGRWVVPVRVATSGGGFDMRCWWCHAITKTAPAKTVTYRLTGPEDDLAVFDDIINSEAACPSRRDVRVERVDS